MNPLGWAHTVAALVALGSGAAVLLAAKGTMRHRRLGWTYAASMLALNVSALFVYRLFGGVGPFHVAAVASLVTVVFGTLAAVRGRRHRLARDAEARARAIEQHYAWMTWSYVGLLAAAVSEVATRVPAFRPRPGQGVAFGITVAVATVVVVAVGARLIRSQRSPLLAPYRRHAQHLPVEQAV
jgi:uncharacterized membrane protein